MSDCKYCGNVDGVCRTCERIEQLRADLATALRESAELIAQRDTALGLCKQREQELAAVTTERVQAENTVRSLALAAVTTERVQAENTVRSLALAAVTAERERHERAGAQAMV